MDWKSLCAAGAMLLAAFDVQAELLNPHWIRENGQPLRIRWGEAYEAVLVGQSKVVSFDDPVQVIENACETSLAAVGRSRMNVRLVTIKLRWARHPKPEKIGQFVKSFGFEAGTTLTLSSLSTADTSWGPPLPFPTLQLPGLGNFLRANHATERIPKVVLEYNAFSNDETRENETRPLMTWNLLNVRADGDEVTFLKSASDPLFEDLPLLFFGIGETVALFEETVGGSARVCQVRFSSSLSQARVIKETQEASVETPFRPLLKDELWMETIRSWELLNVFLSIRTEDEDR